MALRLQGSFLAKQSRVSRVKQYSRFELKNRLLGQTWEYKVFEDKSGAFKYLDGSEGDYHVKSGNIFGDEFKYNKFQNF